MAGEVREKMPPREQTDKAECSPQKETQNRISLTSQPVKEMVGDLYYQICKLSDVMLSYNKIELAHLFVFPV